LPNPSEKSLSKSTGRLWQEPPDVLLVFREEDPGFNEKKPSSGRPSVDTDHNDETVSCEKRLLSCELKLFSLETGLLSCELKLVSFEETTGLLSCELKLSSYEMRLLSCELQLFLREMRLFSCELTLFPCEIRLLSSCKLKLFGLFK
jgi:hypothetical protein